MKTLMRLLLAAILSLISFTTGPFAIASNTPPAQIADSCVPQSSGTLRKELLDLLNKRIKSKLKRNFKLTVRELCAGEIFGGAVLLLSSKDSKNQTEITKVYVLFRSNDDDVWEIFEFAQEDQRRSPLSAWTKKYLNEKNLSSTLATLGLSDNAEAP